ncbi:hypothetical protein KIF24_16515 [Micromonospora sp. Llam7]|uniref:hypothetical protein n=1 Tax=Micromonospora tarapacensis TaxID=2835305 RepID=UPI001C8360BA|nr:hypothetical protein [Micromonospora tarapacensis]MBX7267473.1 hypothetical protein [Micromonospora tarapacensis]
MAGQRVAPTRPAGDARRPDAVRQSDGRRRPGGETQAGDGHRAGPAGRSWPELEPQRSPGGWGGPDPWPALPDDRALWSVPDPGGPDAERLGRLDSEQAGG